MRYQPFVSIIIPCYNRASLLHEAIESALIQTYEHREVIVVDDGSTDETFAVAASYGKRIRVVRQANQGLPAARNTGIAASRGSLIGLLDSDDRWLPNKLEVEVPWFADSRIGLVHGSYRKFPSSHPRSGEIRKCAGAQTGLHEILGFNVVGAPVSVTFRRSAFEQAGRFDSTLWSGEDWDLWIRIATLSRLVGSDVVTAEYRLSDDSMSRNYEKMYRALMRVIAKNRSIHSGCADCRSAARRAAQHARSYYCDLAARDAFRALASGRHLRYLRLRLRGMLRNPSAARRIVPGVVRRLKSRLT